MVETTTAKTKAKSPSPERTSTSVTETNGKSTNANTSESLVAVPGESSSSTESEAVNMEIFEQILELDDEDSHEFSKEMVTAYFSQASSTFKNMDKALAAKDLPELSSLGHFLKGSSAALGISRVQNACEKMQHYGNLRDDDGVAAIDKAEALSRMQVLLPETKSEYAEAERWLKKFYKEKKAPFDDDGGDPPPTAATAS
ncbi:Histidine-phosphotransfer domain HPT-domain-containing protein [Mycena indigotica]|uniref:Histidine-phosphotransfer domain HPT-domain-containing protein n=1 Tax=Mycena indigotica TaxID=2126181 RepID=A0A8H6SI80_9AGAR|nr:Histidine-phosphotransfer domain HPT-domain-containing protein [Mycena indigotica]KAF7299250.1 Histidine-phosphotransfer domain HPT-domain-containing protein [Mycena indigotica]